MKTISGGSMLRILCAFLAAGVFSFVDYGEAETASVICRAASGKLTVRKRCARSERRVSFSDVIKAGYGTLPSGTVVTGAFGFENDFQRGSADAYPSRYTVVSSLPPGVIASGVSDVFFANPAFFSPGCCSSVGACFSDRMQQNASKCGGDVVTPSVPSGVICLYPIAHNCDENGFAGIDAEESGGGLSLTVTLNNTVAVERVTGASFRWVYRAP